MATDETVVIECDECGEIYSPEVPTKKIVSAREQAAEDGWSHVLRPFEVDWCPECSKLKINSTTCGNYAKCKKVGLCHVSCWKPKKKTVGKKGCPKCEGGPCNGGGLGPCGCYVCDYKFGDKACLKCHKLGDHENEVLREMEVADGKKPKKGGVEPFDKEIKEVKDVIKKSKTTENKIFRLEAVNKDKRDAISRLMKEKEVAEARITELSQISLAKDKELDRFNKTERELKTAMEQKEYWKNQYATLSLNKGNPGMKGFPKQRVEVDKNGVVEYCEYADNCPSAKEVSNECATCPENKDDGCPLIDDCFRRRNLQKVVLRCSKCHQIIDKTKPNRVIQQWVGGHLKKRHEHEVCPPPKNNVETRYECLKCGWIGPESKLFTEETSGNAYCPNCINVECKKIKRPKCHKCDDTGWEKTPHPRDGITVPCDCPAGTRMRIKNGWLKDPKKKKNTKKKAK